MVDAPIHPVSLGSPVWLVPWRNAHKWLWPRNETSELVVLPFADPDSSVEQVPVPWLLHAERLALLTQLNVRGVVALQVGIGVQPHVSGRLAPYEHTLPALKQFTTPPVAVLWGEIGPGDPHSTTLSMRAPATGEPSMSATMTVPSALAADAFLDWLSQQGRAVRVPPPRWYAPPPPALLGRYALATKLIVFFVLAKNKVLPVPAPMFKEGIELAYRLAGEPQAPPQCRFFPLTMTILAAHAGVLDEAQRQQALAIARAATNPQDILTLLSPLLLRELGAVPEADARAAPFASYPEPYRAWVQSLAQPA